MTRELSPKAGAAMLRTAFAAKGSPITHTESLDLIAKLKGFNAWSHLQQHEGKITPMTVAGTTVAQPNRTSEEIGLEEVLIEHYGREGECPRFPRERWEKAIWPRPNRSVDYWKWVLSCIDEDTNCAWGATPYTFKRERPVKVTQPDGTVSIWDFEQNLTDRWGDINTYMAETKPGLALLAIDRSLLEKMRSEMYDETTFIGRKDGDFGVYYEMEYVSAESESDNRDYEEIEGLKPHAEVVASLLEGLSKLQSQFPSVQFCIPDESQIINNRPAIWAFVKSGALSTAEREALGTALFNL